MIKTIIESEVKNADLVCTSCGREFNISNHKEGLDYVFETDGTDDWCICMECKEKWDGK